MKFAEIPGLDDVKSLLTAAVRENHLAHAQLLVGAPGALNLPVALALATYIHCQQRNGDACGTCAACSKSDKLVHPDTHFVFPASNVKGEKDDDALKAGLLKMWRAFLLEQPFGNLNDWTEYFGGEDKQAFISREESREIVRALSLKPFESQSKVMIIWQPELMHPSAANGLLKILEEPAPHTYFLLVTNAADKLLPTIISRTQIVTVPLLDDAHIEQYLMSRSGIEPATAARATQLAEGSLNHALKLTTSEEDDNAGRFTEWMRACFKKSYGPLVALADSYHALDKMSQRNLMQFSINMMRETLLKVSGADQLNRSRGDDLKFIQDFSRVMSIDKIERSYRLMNDAAYHLERNGSAKMIFLDLSLQLSKTINP